jgi:hypothetical protein
MKQGTLTLEHDFGIIPHGEKREHEFTLDLKQVPEDYLPLRVHLDCSCGHADLSWRKADGTRRFIDGTGGAQSRGEPGEQLALRLVLDTTKKEPLDLEKTISRGFVVLQKANDLSGTDRVSWPLFVRFGIDAPITLHPLATLDFGRVPQSVPGSLVTTLRGDERHRGVKFRAVASDHPDLAVALEAAEDHWRLRARVTPRHSNTAQDLGHYRATVVVEHDLPGYRLELQAVWKVVPDLEAMPMPKLIVTAPLGQEQDKAKSVGQFVLVTDHDPSRSSEFAVLEVVADSGRDLKPHLALWFEPVPEQPRQHRLFARYLGGLVRGERGRIVLTKDGAKGPFLPLELAIFDKK